MQICLKNVFSLATKYLNFVFLFEYAYFLHNYFCKKEPQTHTTNMSHFVDSISENI